MRDPRELTAALKAQARSLGADAVGITPAALAPLERGGPEAYLSWIAKGMHGSMDYMARDPRQRSDAASWFPRAKSVAVLAFAYKDAAGKEPPPPPHRGRLSLYSVPPDYHKTLKKRLRRLKEWYLDFVPGGDAKIFADTSPVLERLYARLAGVGWIGKNTMVLSRELGSYFFLCGAAFDAEMAYDEPLPDHCGSCDRCLRACPTGAFPEARVLDATRCAAYFTVEHRRGPIPEALREGHGNWIHGCDDCQEVCPWTRHAASRPRAGEPVFVPRLDPSVDLEELAGLSPEDFKERFRGTSLHRTGYAAVMRNALLAMGNSRDARFIPTLERFGNHPDPVLAEQARWSLGRIL